MALIHRLEKFNYTIRLFDTRLPDGMDTVFNLHCVNNLEEIILQSDWIIIIHEKSIINEYCPDYSSLVINEMCSDSTICKIKAGSHIVYINLVEDLPAGFIPLNSAILSGKVHNAHVLFRKTCCRISGKYKVKQRL
ncbi:unnamed protein product [Trichobilharzia regenti]|nr:unnamed protein product [Trichobilharzia regenti]